MIRAADPKTRPQVLEILDSARDLGLKVLRIWAFSEGPIQYNTLQRYPGASLAIRQVPLSFVKMYEHQSAFSAALCLLHSLV